MATPSPTPPFVDDPSAMLIIDWSWWLNKAFRIQGLDGMTAMLVGWLTSTLAYYPAHVALALDSPGLTFRHRMRHPFDEAWRYKAGREIKPDDFYTVAARCTEIAEMHGIPALWADGFEADDAMATATRKARAAGYRVWLCTADKDLEGLTEESDTYGITVGLWDNSERTIKGPIEVEERRGVKPEQIADLLAITGDSGDNVPGVPGLGAKGAAAILQAHGNLEAALAARPAVDPHRSERSLAKRHQTLLDHADVARFSRQLTGLDFDAPIDVPWHDLPIGGLDVDALRARYASLGFTGKVSQVSPLRKRAPWAIGYNG